MGWMFRTFCVRANGPIPKLLLFWTGTLMSLATGFWTAFCKLAAPSRLVWLVTRTPVVLQAECQRKESTKATTLLESLWPLTVLRPRRPACGSEARLKGRTRGCTLEAERVRTLRTSPGIFSSCTQLGMASISLRRSRQLFRLRPFESAARAGVSRLCFRPNLVVAHRPHEHLLVDGLSGIIEHR